MWKVPNLRGIEQAPYRETVEIYDFGNGNA